MPSKADVAAAKYNNPGDFCMFWLTPKDAAELLAEQQALDALPPSLQAMVKASPLPVSCVILLAGCRKCGAEAMGVALSALIAKWRAVREGAGA